MNLLKTIKSQKDNTVKYVFSSNNSILEFSYINKNDGKDIICVPTQATCNLGCKFCFLTGLKIPQRNLTSEELNEGIEYVVSQSGTDNKILLISFMGCGDGLLNINSVIFSSLTTERKYRSYEIVRFAIASLIPNRELFERFTKMVSDTKLKMKFHYSLHTPKPDVRKELMPNASDICIDLLEKYVSITGNAVEIHYSMIDEVNDDDNDADLLISMLQNKPINVKLLKLAEKDENKLIKSKRINDFMKRLGDAGIEVEYYEPPGEDIGSSCGQFLLDYYKDIPK